MQLGNGEELQVEEYIKLRVEVQQYYGHLTCVVIKFSDNIDLILDDNCLNKYKAHVHQESKTCVIRKGKQTFLLQVKPLMH